MVMIDSSLSEFITGNTLILTFLLFSFSLNKIISVHYFLKKYLLILEFSFYIFYYIIKFSLLSTIFSKS